MSTSSLAQMQHFLWSAAWQEEVGCWFGEAAHCLPVPALQQTPAPAVDESLLLLLTWLRRGSRGQASGKGVLQAYQSPQKVWKDDCGEEQSLPICSDSLNAWVQNNCDEDRRFGWSCTSLPMHGNGSKMQNETACEEKEIFFKKKRSKK